VQGRPTDNPLDRDCTATDISRDPHERVRAASKPVGCRLEGEGCRARRSIVAAVSPSAGMTKVGSAAAQRRRPDADKRWVGPPTSLLSAATQRRRSDADKRRVGSPTPPLSRPSRATLANLLLRHSWASSTPRPCLPRQESSLTRWLLP
jgi:hypothetical protein